YTFDFNQGDHEWEVLFSDYPVGEESNYELSFEKSGLPAPLDPLKKSIKVTGNNHSDDLLSIIYRKIDGLEPNTRYAVSFSINFASNVCKSCVGVGGSPNLALGAGGLPHAPGNLIVGDNEFPYYRPNFITEIQGYRSNSAMKMLGRIGVGEELSNPYAISNLNNKEAPIYLTSNAKGELWLIVGTDSGFEATTTLYYTKIEVILKK
ncbi:MAG: hypothetical protein WKI04_13725, partial [Ferruginibacter sp.]